MSKGKEFLSELKFYTDYAKWDDKESRYETWEEACKKVLDTHLLRYGSTIKPLIDEVLPSYQNKEFLASQRSLQFRGDQIVKHNTRMYNCCVTYCNTPDVFSKGFYILLSGTGLGVNMFSKFTKQLPKLHKRTKGTITYTIEDSIQGWAEASRVLLSSYCKHSSLDEKYFGYIINFDYSLIRPRGAFITGGFKAPGHEGLKQSLERIASMLDYEIDGHKSIEFRDIIAYDIFMHLSDAVLSGGVRRSAMNIIFGIDQAELLNAKMGDWRQKFPWRARSNNSVGLLRHKFTEEELASLISMNEGDNDVGFVFMNSVDEIFNPCYEIGFNFWKQIVNTKEGVFQFCNLTEVNATACVTKSGKLNKAKLFEAVRNATIVGTLQAGYTDFPHINKQTEDIVAGEALLGVSITGWMANPELFDDEVLKECARIVRETNEEVAKIIGINPGARLTCVKPSGNASVLLMTPSGIHGEHSPRYFRIMQLNKDSETAKWLEEYAPDMLEESVWSANNTDYVVFMPCENSEFTIIKDDLMGVKHMEMIRQVQRSWVREGTVKERGYNPKTEHNVSCTILIDNDREDVSKFLFDNQDDFTAVSFLSNFGDKDYNQAPFTSVLNTQELVDKYGDAVVFMSGLIVDGLDYFNNNLWDATDHILNPDLPIHGTKEQIMLRKWWLKRAKKFANNYFKRDLKQMVYCMKDVHLWHKWNNINRGFKVPNFSEILSSPDYKDISDYASIACAGGACEIV